MNQETYERILRETLTGRLDGDAFGRAEAGWREAYDIQAKTIAELERQLVQHREMTTLSDSVSKALRSQILSLVSVIETLLPIAGINDPKTSPSSPT